MSAPILVTGASGKLGAYVVRHLAKAGRPVVAWSGQSSGEVCGIPLQPVPLDDPGAIRTAYAQARPQGVIHCAAVSAISEVYRDEARALRVNRDATKLLGELTPRIVYTSTDLVFGGDKAPYDPGAPPDPLSKYGASKVAGEQALGDHAGASRVRLSLMYGPILFGGGGFHEQQVKALRASESIRLFRDEWRTPLAYDEAAKGLVELFDKPHRGLLHLGGSERLSRHQMGLGLAEVLGVTRELVESNLASEIEFPEPRPADVSLDSSEINELLGWTPRPFVEGLKRLGV